MIILYVIASAILHIASLIFLVRMYRRSWIEVTGLEDLEIDRVKRIIEDMLYEKNMDEPERGSI